MTAKIESPPIKSLKELSNSKYSVGVQRGSATEAVFFEAEPESEEYNLMKNKKVIHFNGSQVVILENMVNDAKLASLLPTTAKRLCNSTIKSFVASL